jgi:hypothetical protein
MQLDYSNKILDYSENMLKIDWKELKKETE